MTSFLTIRAGETGKRVDFSDFANLFADDELPRAGPALVDPSCRPSRRMMPLMSALLALVTARWPNRPFGSPAAAGALTPLTAA